MKTSVIEVHDMLAVLTVDEVEKRLREVSGVASATVNYAAGNATVRYDETLLEVADIKVIVHQRGQQSAVESKPEDDSASKSDHQLDDRPEHKHAEAPMPDAPTGSASTPKPAAPKKAMPSPAALPDEGQGAKPPPGAPPPIPAPAVPNAALVAPAATPPNPATPAEDGQQDKKTPTAPHQHP